MISLRMNRFFGIAVPVVLVLAACSPAQSDEEHPVRHTGLSVFDQTTEEEIVFAVLQNGQPFTDFGVSHTKEMHLIVVRDDLRHFEHLHPERGSDGVWRVPFAASAAGTYWMFADFVDTTGMHYTLRFDRTYAGDPGEQGITSDPVRTVRAGRYFVNMGPRVSPDAASFQYTVTDASGAPVELEEYLGAKGHTVLISELGEYMHTHPMDNSNTPTFMTDVPHGHWKIFTQFQVEGEVLTAEFDWISERDSVPSSAGM